jgi:hypothetical protein
MDRIFVSGTSSGKTYLAIARKGNIVLSVKPNMIGDADNLGVPGLTYFGARLRSAPATDLATHDQEKGIVPFGKYVVDDKWGGVDWEKADAHRASAQVGTFLRGTIAQDADQLLANFSDGILAKKFAKFLIGQAGEGVEFLTTEADLGAWLEETYAPQLKKIVAGAAKFKELQMKIGEQVGVFASQTTLLKKMFAGMPKENMSDAVGYALAEPETDSTADGESATTDHSDDEGSSD